MREADIEISPTATVIQTPAGIAFYRMATLKQGLKLEIKGIRMCRGATCYSIIKREFGLKGSREKVLEAFTKLCDETSAKMVRVTK